MQFITEVKQKAVVLIEQNATTLLTAGGVVGTVATAVLTGRATFKAAEIIRNEEVKHVEEADKHTMGLSTVERAKVVWPLYVPPVVIGGATIASIIMANRMSAQKAAALAAAYGLAERNLTEYKTKVSEKLTGPKRQQIDDEIARDRVHNSTADHEQIVIIEGSDNVLCFDEPTGRYFKSTPEKIRRAVNATNAEILRHNGASVSYFYDELELPPTNWSDTLGWGIGEQMDVKYSYIEAKDGSGRPVLSIDFQKAPTMSWNDGYR